MMLGGYWYGDGHVLRVPLSALPPGDALTEDAFATFAAGLGFPTRLDGSRHAASEAGVLVFGPAAGQARPSPAGREDLDAESVVIWLRQRTVTALLFAKTIRDLATILSMIATYEHAIEQISAQGEQAQQRRMEQAQEVRTIVTPAVSSSNALQLSER
jgi:hypothetical protein